jgi:hypothetical protein
MKRRGFVPNIRTYATMMSGYATVEDWGPLTKRLDAVHFIYEQLRHHLEKSRNLAHDPQAAGEMDTSFILYPISLYISILGKAGQYQKAFDVFHGLDTDGPLAPHPKVYSSLLCVLADRVDSPDAEVKAQTVSDAKYVWRRHMRSLDRQPEHHIEPRSVDAIIKVLSRGEPSDHELMFDILHGVCGLPRPQPAGKDEYQRPLPLPSSPPLPSKVEPNMWILSEALDGCTAAGRPDLAVHYAQSVMDCPELRPILRPWHLPKLLRAHSILAKEGSTSPAARSENVAAWVEWMMSEAHKETAVFVPRQYTLTSALALCHRCEDTTSALRIARVMLERPMHGGSMPAKAWTYLLQTAITASPDERRQCLELLNTYNSVLDVWESGSAVKRLAVHEKRAHVSLALCVIELLQNQNRNVAPPSLNPDDMERSGSTEFAQAPEAWSDLRRRAESFLTMARSGSWD